MSASVIVLPQMVSPVAIIASADDEGEDSKKSDFISGIKGAGYGESFSKDLDKAGKDYSKEKTYTVDWYINYMLRPGNYINDINEYAPVKSDTIKTDETVVHEVDGKKSVCGFDKEPQNLLNHNCDIPAFMTELMQNVTRDVQTSGIQGHERTPAYLGVLELGMPKDIPTGKVPVNPKERTTKYTALELFGYDLEHTTYSGEYDHIVTSSEARLMSNVGFWGKLKLAGNSIFTGVENVFKDFISGSVFNPNNWGGKSPGFVDGVVSTVIDTSDYNLVSMHAWKRPYLNNTLYNVHYLSDKAVIEKAQNDFFKVVRENLFSQLANEPEAKEVLSLMPGQSTFPVFKFDNKKYTEKSNKAIKEWEKCSRTSKNCGKKPVPEVVTEEEQFKQWKNEPTQKAFNEKAKSHKIDCFDKAKNYKEITGCWDTPFRNYAKEVLSADSGLVQKIIENLEERYLSNNIYADPSRGISHYVCADEEGNTTGTMSDWKYYYTSENTREQEFINKGCSLVRPSIKGAKYGTGDDKSTDTRYLLYKQGVIPRGRGVLGTLGVKVARISAKITNTLISFAFSNIIEELSLDTIIQTTMETFRDSIFFPLATMLIAITGLWILYQAVSAGGRPWKAIASLVLTFIVGSALILNAGKVLLLIEKGPTMIDEFIADVVLVNETGHNYCDGDSGSDQVRQIQCEVWSITIFQPWVRGQFGAAYENLNANKMKNTNKALVGDAPVDMGGGHIEHNWALWQLSKTKSGTITSTDLTNPTGSTSRALYKLVDLQAGPNNGKESDSRFLWTWAGLTGERARAGFWQGIISICLLIVIGGLCIAKLEMTFELLIRVAMLPVVLAKALLPRGETKIVEYANDLIGVFIKRVFVVLVLSVSLNILNNIASLDADYGTIGLCTTAMVVAIGFYWKELIRILNNSSAAVGNMRQKLAPSRWLPKSANLKYNQIKGSIKYGTAGAIGGAIGGAQSMAELKKKGYKVSGGAILEGAKTGYRKNAGRTSTLLMRKQRKTGFGMLKQMKDAYEQGASKGVNGITQYVSEGQRSTLSRLYNTTLDRKAEIDAQIKIVKKDIADNPGDPDKIQELNSLEAQSRALKQSIENINRFTNDGNANSTGTWTPTGNFAIDKTLLNVDFDKIVKDNEGVKRVLTPSEVADKVAEQINGYEEKARIYREKQEVNPVNQKIEKAKAEVDKRIKSGKEAIKDKSKSVAYSTVLREEAERQALIEKYKDDIDKLETGDTIQDFANRKQIEEYVNTKYKNVDDERFKQLQADNIEYTLKALMKEGNLNRSSTGVTERRKEDKPGQVSRTSNEKLRVMKEYIDERKNKKY